jgi:hypothetical protein
MALRVVNHYPAINAIDVPRNIYIKIEFNSGIIPTSLDYTHVSVNDSFSYASVPGSLGVEYNVSGVPTIVKFQPSINLTASTKYKVYVFGKPNSVLSKTNEQLDNTYLWEFTTGTTVLEGQMPTGIPSGELPTSGTIEEVPESILGDATLDDLVASGFRVISTNPTNMSANNATNLSGISIYFNTNITSSIAQLSGLVSMTVTDVLY